MALPAIINPYFTKRTGYVPNRFWCKISNIEIEPEYIKSISFSYPKPVIAEDVYTFTNSLQKLPYIKSVENSSTFTLNIHEKSDISYRGELYKTLLNIFLSNSYENKGVFNGSQIIIKEVKGGSKKVLTTVFNAIFNSLSEITLDNYSDKFLEYTLTMTIINPKNITTFEEDYVSDKQSIYSSEYFNIEDTVEGIDKKTSDIPKIDGITGVGVPDYLFAYSPPKYMA